MSHQRTLAEMVQSLRYNLDDTGSTPRWTTAILTDNLNHAKDRVWNEVRKERKDYFLSTRLSTDGTVTILGESYSCAGFQITDGPTTGNPVNLTLPPDFAELRSFRVITSGYTGVRLKLTQVSDVEYRQARAYPDPVSPTTILMAVVNERSMAFGPKTDVDLDTELVYIYQPADLITGESLQMPYPLDSAVEALATATAFAQDDDARAAVWQNIYRDIVANVIGATDRQTQDATIVESADVFWP